MSDKDPRLEEIQGRSRKLCERIDDLHAYENNLAVWLSTLSFSLMEHFAECPAGLESFDRIVISMRELLFEMINVRKELNDLL